MTPLLRWGIIVDVAYIAGELTIERVIRPNAVEELLCLLPDGGGKAIIFDLEESMKRAGLCEFIKECAAAKTPLHLESDGGMRLPAALENRFEFYREFYGLTRWAVLGVEILQTSDKKEEKKAEGGEEKTMKKLDPEPPPAPKKPKQKISKKLEARALNIIPAGIVWVAEGGIKKPGPKEPPKLSALPLSGKLGGLKVGLSAVSLGRPASGLKSLGGMSR